MYCPKCATEYREGFTWCSDCEVQLVAQRPIAVHSMDPVLEEKSPPAEPVKSELDWLASMDKSLMTIKQIAIWWLILSIVAVVTSVLYVLGKIY